MWYFQCNKTKPNDSVNANRNNISETRNNAKKSSEPTPEKRMPYNSPKMAETTQQHIEMQPVSAPLGNPISRGANLDDAIEKAMRDVMPEEKISDIG